LLKQKGGDPYFSEEWVTLILKCLKSSLARDTDEADWRWNDGLVPRRIRNRREGNLTADARAIRV
jgi:hypothetical protein